MFDDHEIVNDYATGPDDPLYTQAIEPFEVYQRAVNPAPIDPARPTYTSFNIANVAFFVLDNRSFRSVQPHRPSANSSAGHGSQTMLGATQLQAVREWVQRESEAGRLLVLVSGVPMTRNWSEGKDEFDSWAVSALSRCR